MTVPAVSCKALATQNSSEWPCSMCPIPPGSGLWGWGHPIYIFLIFLGHPESWTPSQIPSWGPPLGCTLLHQCIPAYTYRKCNYFIFVIKVLPLCYVVILASSSRSERSFIVILPMSLNLAYIGDQEKSILKIKVLLSVPGQDEKKGFNLPSQLKNI